NGNDYPLNNNNESSHQIAHAILEGPIKTPDSLFHGEKPFDGLGRDSSHGEMRLYILFEWVYIL
ncbi:hypothetical protein, partial [Aliikangiella maris]